MWSDDDAVEYDSEHEVPSATVVEDPEVWMDHYSEELLDLWYSLKEQCESRGLAVLDTCTFPNFAQFCFQFSSGYPPPV